MANWNIQYPMHSSYLLIIWCLKERCRGMLIWWDIASDLISPENSWSKHQSCSSRATYSSRCAALALHAKRDDTLPVHHVLCAYPSYTWFSRKKIENSFPADTPPLCTPVLILFLIPSRWSSIPTSQHHTPNHRALDDHILPYFFRYKINYHILM